MSDHFIKDVVGARPLLLLLNGHSTHHQPEVVHPARSKQILMHHILYTRLSLWIVRCFCYTCQYHSWFQVLRSLSFQFCGPSGQSGNNNAAKESEPSCSNGQVNVSPATEISSPHTDVSMAADAEASGFSPEQLQLYQKRYDEGIICLLTLIMFDDLKFTIQNFVPKVPIQNHSRLLHYSRISPQKNLLQCLTTLVVLKWQLLCRQKPLLGILWLSYQGCHMSLLFRFQLMR